MAAGVGRSGCANRGRTSLPESSTICRARADGGLDAPRRGHQNARRQVVRCDTKLLAATHCNQGFVWVLDAPNPSSKVRPSREVAAGPPPPLPRRAHLHPSATLCTRQEPTCIHTAVAALHYKSMLSAKVQVILRGGFSGGLQHTKPAVRSSKCKEGRWQRRRTAGHILLGRPLTRMEERPQILAGR